MGKQEGTAVAQKASTSQIANEVPEPFNKGYNLKARAAGRRLYGELVKQHPLPLFEFPVERCASIEASAGGSFLAIVEEDHKPIVVRIQISQKSITEQIALPTLEGKNIALLPQLDSVVCREFLKEVGEHGALWHLYVTNLHDGSKVELPEKLDEDDPIFMTVGLGAPIVICRSFDTLHIWQLKDKWYYHKITRRRGLSACCVHPEGNHFACCVPGPSGIFSVASGESVVDLDGLWTNLLRSITFSRSGRLLAATGSATNSEQVTLLWDWKNKEVVFEAKGGAESGKWVRISNAEDILVSVSDESVVSLWNLKSKNIVGQFVTGSKITGGVAFADNDNLIAIGCEDSIKIFELEDVLKETVVDDTQ